MKIFLAIPLLVFVSLQVCNAQTLPGRLSIVSEWPGAFNGMFVIPITEQVTGGWTMEIKFSGPVTNFQIWDADVETVSSDNKTYKLRNKSYNQILAIGNTLSISFIGYISDPVTPAARVTLFGSEEDSLATQPPPPTPDVETDSVLIGGLEIDSSWDKHFKGFLVVEIPQRITGGWTMEVVFNKRVKSVEIWDADIQSMHRNRKTYTFVNKSWNAKLAQGSTLSLQFIGEINVRRPPTATVTLRPYYLHPFEPTTLAPTTTVTTAAITSVVSTTTVTEPAQKTEGSVETEAPVTTPSEPAATTTTESAPKTETPIETEAPVTPSNKQTTTEATVKRTTESSGPVTPGPYDYSEVLHKSILFYEAQRSGKLPSSNRIQWRADSALNDHGEHYEDLTGGWYDAGDYVKFGLPMAWSATTLAWGVLEYRDAYQAAGELDNVLDSLKWATDYFLKCHTAQNEFYAQVGDGNIDHAYWGRPEDMTMNRPAFKVTTSKPGSDVVGQTAATLAAASMVFKDKDANYANTLLNNAKSLYSFANNYRGVYSDSVPASPFYTSYSGYGDELTLAAVWLYRATNDKMFLDEAKMHYLNFGVGGTPWAFSWDDNTAAVQLLMYMVTNDDVYKSAIQSFVNGWLPNGGITYTPKGLAWRDEWGSLRYSANAAFLALVAADNGINQQALQEFAKSQIHYMLGSTGRSFVVGFGENPPTQPHHASSSCPDKPAQCNWNNFNANAPNPHILYGALVGGPDAQDNYKDVRNDYIANEVACDYNAGFQSAVAGLKHLEITGKL